MSVSVLVWNWLQSIFADDKSPHLVHPKNQSDLYEALRFASFGWFKSQKLQKEIGLPHPHACGTSANTLTTHPNLSHPKKSSPIEGLMTMLRDVIMNTQILFLQDSKFTQYDPSNNLRYFT